MGENGSLVYGVPAAGVVALIFAFVKSSSVSKADAGTDEYRKPSQVVLQMVLVLSWLLSTRYLQSLWL